MPRAPLPAPARHPHVTVGIPEALRTALRDLALRRGQRAEAVVADLFQRGLDRTPPSIGTGRSAPVRAARTHSSAFGSIR